MANEKESNRAEWMAGGWGVRVLLPAGDNKDVYDFNPAELVNQLSILKTPKWIMINLTSGAYGGKFTAPNADLERVLTGDMFPKRDLLLETIRLLKSKNFKVILYFASQGPLSNLDKIKNKENPNVKRIVKKKLEVIESWKSYLKSAGLSHTDGMAILIKYYSDKYAKDIDGWWFDHGDRGDPEKYILSARSGNERAVVAWSQEHERISVVNRNNKKVYLWGVKKSNKYEDYTAGHTTPDHLLPAWSPYNERIIEKLEFNSHRLLRDEGLVAHYFSPIQKRWRSGSAGFNEDLLYDWTRRVIESKAAVTWAIAMKSPEFKYSEVENIQFQQLVRLDMKIRNKIVALPILR